MEDLAADYLKDLINRNLVLVSQKTSNGGIRTCRIHDMLRELCLRKAEERNLVQPIDWYKRVASPSTPISSNNLCFHSHGFHDLSENPLCTNFRSHFFYASERTPPRKLPTTSFVYKFLWSLNLCYIVLKVFPLEILQLFHLRFLELWIDHLDKRPLLISNLWNLESLVITKEEWDGVIIPVGIWKMVKLRHLRISQEIEFETPLSNSGCPYLLNELQILSALKLSHSGKDAEDILARTPNLRKLTFYRGPSGHLEWKEISKLGKLPRLEILKLRRNCFSGHKWKTGDGEFCQLKFMKLSWMDLKQWIITSTSHFPNLERLVVDTCKYLEEIPAVIGDVPSLETIEVYWLSCSAVNSAKRIQEDQKSKGNDGLKVISYSIRRKGGL
ncbi:Disease resistance protein RPP8 [Abeliophyllum distichum]|uniref:Disease resistance protein RPP8 n=1 Tax=Abeliophyllum distichum TaxID=126358 RepID=A0ABD1Q8P4_9LAMI